MKQREIKREKERERERKREKEREREREREIEMMAALEGMTGALAPFSYPVCNKD